MNSSGCTTSSPLQAAYECLYTLLLTCIERLDVNQFIGLVEEGLRDHHDIMLLTHLMFIRLVAVAHTQVHFLIHFSNTLHWYRYYNT